MKLKPPRFVMSDCVVCRNVTKQQGYYLGNCVVYIIARETVLKKRKLSHIIKNMNLRADSNIGSGGNDEKCLHTRIITRFLCIVDKTRMIFEHVGYVLH